MFPLAVLALVARDLAQPDKVVRVVRSAVLMQLAITLAFLVAILVGVGYFVGAINTPPEIRQRTEAFLATKSLAIPFEALGLLFIISIKAMRKGALAVGIAAFGVVMNFILDAFLISDFAFSLRLGLIGSAWGYVATKVAVFIVGAGAFYATVSARPEAKLDRE